MKIAIGMDLHKSKAVCFASYAGDGEPNEKNVAFLERVNEEFHSQASTPEAMATLATALRGHEAWFLIENSTKTFETYWVLTNMGMTTSAVSLMRNVGSTVGTACYSLVIASQMNSKFADSIYSFVNDIFNFNGTGLIALRYIPGFDIPGQATLAETIVEIFGTSVCAAFLFGGLIYIVALVISFTMDKKYTVSEDENRH